MRMVALLWDSGTFLVPLDQATSHSPCLPKAVGAGPAGAAAAVDESEKQAKYISSLNLETTCSG